MPEWSLDKIIDTLEKAVRKFGVLIFSAVLVAVLVISVLGVLPAVAGTLYTNFSSTVIGFGSQSLTAMQQIVSIAVLVMVVGGLIALFKTYGGGE